MKILYISDPGVVGGATRSLVELVALMQNKYSVDCVVCTSTSRDLGAEIESHGAKCIYSNHMAVMDVCPNISYVRLLKMYMKLSCRYYKSIASTLKRIESQVDMSSFDLIHTNSLRNDIGCILSRKYHIPHIVHIREFGKEDFHCWTYRPFYATFVNRRTDQFIAISEAVKKSWVGKGISAKKIRVIYNGVNNQKILHADLNSQRSNDLRMIIVGGVCPTKGQYQAIEALSLLPEEVKNHVSLDIAGWSEPSYISHLYELIEKRGLKSNVKYLGERKDIYNILCNYHVGLMCSKSEGFGRVTAEYMHAGLAVIASDTGANPELIHDHENGLLYQYGDFKDLEEKILFLYYNNIERYHLAECGKTDAAKNYTHIRNAEQIYSLYREMLARR